MTVSTTAKFLNAKNALTGTCDALVLTCIDYRYLDEIPKYLHTQKPPNMTFDHTILAGASLGLFTGVRPSWASTFWEHLDVSIALHKIKKVFILDHRDCGAYREFKVLGPRPELGTSEFDRYYADETFIHHHYMDRVKKFVEDIHEDLHLEVITHLLPVPGEPDPCKGAASSSGG